MSDASDVRARRDAEDRNLDPDRVRLVHRVHVKAAGRDERVQYKSGDRARDCWAGSAYRDEEQRVRRGRADAPGAPPYPAAGEQSDELPADRQDSVLRADATAHRRPWGQPAERRVRLARADEEQDARGS